jgi:hypothetical protein
VTVGVYVIESNATLYTNRGRPGPARVEIRTQLIRDGDLVTARTCVDTQVGPNDAVRCPNTAVPNLPGPQSHYATGSVSINGGPFVTVYTPLNGG